MATKEDTARANLDGLQKVGEGWHMLVATALDRGEHKLLGMERRDYAIAAGRPRLDDAEDQKRRIRELADAGFSQTLIAEILGLGKDTVRAYMPSPEIGPARSDSSVETGPGRSDEVDGEAEEMRPLTKAERQMAVADMLEEGGWTDAAMAEELAVSPGTISKDRSDIERERKLAGLREEREANMPPEHEQKANSAALDDALAGTNKALASLSRVDAYIDSAIETVDQVEELGGEIQNFDWVVSRFAELGRRLWEHGAMRGFDVSKISDAIHRFDEGEA